MGVGHPEHRARLGSREGAQPDAVGQVRIEPAQPALVEPLRGEQQVDAERSAEPPDRDEEIDELRALGEQLGELVDDDQQCRQRGQVTPVGAARTSYSATPVRLPAARSSSWRRVSSPSSASAIRSTRCSSSARLVITAETCGRLPRPRKVAPPLKSTRTKFSSADEWVATRPSTSVRSSSLLPDPVAPMNRPCGPMPPWADSLRSSATGAPASSTPSGTHSRSADWRRRSTRSASTASAVTVPGAPRARPSSSGRPAADSGPARGPAPAGR